MGQGSERFFYVVYCYGGDEVAAAIYQYGAPRRIYALRAFLAKQQELTIWRKYCANVLWAIPAHTVPKYRVPAYTELWAQKKKNGKEPTGDEIVAQVQAEIEKRIERRNGDDAV